MRNPVEPVISMYTDGTGGPGLGWTATVEMYRSNVGFRVVQRGDDEYIKRGSIRGSAAPWLLLARYLSRQEDIWSVPEGSSLTARGVEDWQAAVLGVCWTQMEGRQAGVVLLQVPQEWLAEAAAKHAESEGAPLESLVQTFLDIEARLAALDLGRDLSRALRCNAAGSGGSSETSTLLRSLGVLEKRDEGFSETWQPGLRLLLQRAKGVDVERLIASLRSRYMARGHLSRSGRIRAGSTVFRAEDVLASTAKQRAEAATPPGCSHSFSLKVSDRVRICTSCAAVSYRTTAHSGYHLTPRDALAQLQIDSEKILREFRAANALPGGGEGGTPAKRGES